MSSLMTTSQEPSVRDKILATAGQLFYRDGYRAVGIDTIIAEAGVAKMSLYRHFSSKDELIVAYLTESNQQFWKWLEAETEGIQDPAEVLVAMFAAFQRQSTTPQCFGCTFQGVASEFPEMSHPGHQVAMDHKRQVVNRFTHLAEQAQLNDPDELANQLLLLMDGAWIASRMFGSDNPAKNLTPAATALIEAKRPRGAADSD